MNDIKTSEDLRNFLANELKKVTNGETTPSTANAAANLSGKIISSVFMELQYSKMIGVTPSIDFIKNIKRENPKQIENK